MRISRIPYTLSASLILLLLLLSPLPSSVLYVSPNGDDSADGSSWAKAKRAVPVGLNRAVAGDEIWIAAGTYVGAITMKEGVALYGGFSGTETERSQRNWTANHSILDMDLNREYLIQMPDNATRATRIDGFTIRNGYVGIEAYGCSPVIANNTLSDLTSAIATDLCGTALITGNTFRNNGRDVYCRFTSPTIIGNTFEGGAQDYAIHCISSSSIIKDNHFHGRGISCEIYHECDYTQKPAHDTLPLIASNVIAGATNGISCDGYIKFGTCAPRIINNTITNCSGAGISAINDAHATITSNIIARNATGVSGGPSAFVLCNNCVFGNTSANYQGVIAGAGDIPQDPLFMDPVNDCHLQAGSPCIDAGDDTEIASDWLDLDANPRIRGAHVDIGAYEAPSAGAAVEWPAFSQSPGQHFSELDVAITSGTAGAVIHYTTDGTEPTESAPIVASGSSVHISQSTMLKARAWKDGMAPSAIAAASYELKVPAPAFNPPLVLTGSGRTSG